MIEHLDSSPVIQARPASALVFQRHTPKKLGGKRANGLTLIEVIFATGVVLIGLVGLASILPLAGRRAQDALDFDTGAMIAVATSKEIQAREFINRNDLVSVSGQPLFTVSGSNVLIRPFCFDPLFAYQPPANQASYQSGFFPFYSPDHDVLLDPADPTSNSATGGFAGQSRMLRAGFSFAGIPVTGDLDGDSDTDADDTAIGLARMFSITSYMSESSSDLSQLAAKDKTLAPALQSLTAVAGGFFAGTTVPTGQYTWFATVDPDPTSTTANLSVVVLRSRDRAPTYPATVPERPDGNMIAERIALVSPLYVDSSGGTPPASVGAPTGFSGGAGGLVTLVSAGNTPSRLTSNDWVMLTRVLDTTNADATTVHRWYRVIASPGDVVELTPDSMSSSTEFVVPNETNNLTVPAPPTGITTRTNVWAQSVLLDGSDWGFETDVAAGSVTNTLTYATIVRDVVAVHTTNISLTDF
jgi:Tfp pilus assembly protein PilV